MKPRAAACVVTFTFVAVCQSELPPDEASKKIETVTTDWTRALHVVKTILEVVITGALATITLEFAARGGGGEEENNGDEGGHVNEWPGGNGGGGGGQLLGGQQAPAMVLMGD